MVELIIKFERDLIWQYGNATCAAYPLATIDTIDERTGELNQDSALSFVVYGVLSCS